MAKPLQNHAKYTYSLNIVYFNLGVGDDYIYHHRGNFIGVNNGDTLQPLKSQIEQAEVRGRQEEKRA